MIAGAGFGLFRLPQKAWNGSKGTPRTATSGGRGDAYEIVEKIISKLLYRPAGILHNKLYT
jgi:hypothetical protein